MEHTKGELKVLPLEPRIISLVTGKNYVIATATGQDKVAEEDRAVSMVSFKEAEANAERLVKCWNEHDKLERQKADLLAAMDKIRKEDKYRRKLCDTSDLSAPPIPRSIIENIAIAAIAKAKD